MRVSYANCYRYDCTRLTTAAHIATDAIVRVERHVVQYVKSISTTFFSFFFFFLTFAPRWRSTTFYDLAFYLNPSGDEWSRARVIISLRISVRFLRIKNIHNEIYFDKSKIWNVNVFGKITTTKKKINSYFNSLPKRFLTCFFKNIYIRLGYVSY